MIKHIVMWDVRGTTQEEKLLAINELKAAFSGLEAKIPGLLHMEVGVDMSRASYACDVVLYSEFDSRESLAAYAEHPEHARVKRLLVDVRVARHQVEYDMVS